jgi:hypothetical protein
MAETIILDTNVLKHVSRGSQPIADALVRRLNNGDQVWVARAAYNELIGGAPNQKMAGQYREMLTDLHINIAQSGNMADRVNFLADNIQRQPAPNTPGQIKEYGSKGDPPRPGDAFVAAQVAAQARDMNAKLWTIDDKFAKRANAMGINTVPECNLSGAGGNENPDAGRSRLGLNPKAIGSNGEVLPSAGSAGGGRGGGSYSLEGVADNTVPEFVPPSAKGQATIAGIQLAFEGINFVLNLVNDYIQKQKVHAALDQIKPQVASVRASNPRLGVLLIFFYMQSQAPDESIIKPGATFDYLTWGKGVTSDEAWQDAFSAPSIASAPDANRRKFTQEIWIPPAVKTSVTTAKCPLKPIAVGRFFLGNSNKAKFQVVSFDVWSGFDDIVERTLDLPDNTNPEFAILKSPSEVYWYNINGRQTVSVPLTDATTANGNTITVVDLDPWLPFNAKAAMVFPINDLTEIVFNAIHPTQGYPLLSTYVNFSMVRWIRAQNIHLLRFL